MEEQPLASGILRSFLKLTHYGPCGTVQVHRIPSVRLERLSEEGGMSWLPAAAGWRKVTATHGSPGAGDKSLARLAGQICPLLLHWGWAEIEIQAG